MWFNIFLLLFCFYFIFRFLFLFLINNHTHHLFQINILLSGTQQIINLSGILYVNVVLRHMNEDDKIHQNVETKWNFFFLFFFLLLLYFVFCFIFFFDDETQTNKSICNYILKDNIRVPLCAYVCVNRDTIM